MRALTRIALIAAALLGGCGRGTHGPIEASLIGDPARAPADAFATTTGLVRLDCEGQVIPAAAARWAILDDGLDYIFRIDDAAGIGAHGVARSLRTAVRRARGTPTAALLAPIESIAAVTATVVEIRLAAPQPDLLVLLARPEFAVGAAGPLRDVRRTPDGVLLHARAVDDRPSPPVLLRTEPAGRAVARFVAGRATVVLGGGFADLAVARAGRLRRGELRFDPVTGLFGFAVRDAAGPAGDARLREALALAIDRDRIVGLLGAPGQAKATTLAGSAIEPSLAERRATAGALLTGRDLPSPLRIAMPQGPGAQLLFALVAQDWRRIGISATMVAADRPADLALVDMVAPPGALAPLACAISAGCDPRDRLALIAPPFIPLSAPVRWSLVARGLDGFVENAQAAHPLDQLHTGS